jgi:hypothetical protein
MTWTRRLLFAASFCFVSAMAFAEVTTEVKKGIVTATWANQLVVKMPDGTYRQYTIPAGFQFDHEGRKVGVAELKPGWEVTATITTTTTPEVVQVTELRNGEVVQVNGRSLIYKDDAGKNQSWTPPEGFKFMVDGQPTDVADLKPKTKLAATIVRTTRTTKSKRQVSASAKSPN